MPKPKPDDVPRFTVDALQPGAIATVRHWADLAQHMIATGAVGVGCGDLQKDVEEARRIAERMEVFKRVYEAMPGDLPHNVRTAAAQAAAEKLYNKD